MNLRTPKHACSHGVAESATAAWREAPVPKPHRCHTIFSFFSSHFLGFSRVLSLVLGLSSFSLLPLASLSKVRATSSTPSFPSVQHSLWASPSERPSLQGVKSTCMALVCCCQRQLFNQLLDLSHSTVYSCLLSTSLPPV